MNVNFTGKVVLVTGGSSGIGKATGLLFAKLGAHVALVGRNAARLAAVAKQCEQEKGLKALTIVADLSTDVGCIKVVREAIGHFKRLDVLVNNAAIPGLTTILGATDMVTFDRVFQMNVRGMYNLTRLLVEELIKTKGCIINISSIIRMTMVGSLDYDMSRAATDHFTKLIALELAPKGVRVNSVAPGITITEGLLRGRNPNENQEEFLNAADNIVPLGKTCTGEDIAKMVAFLSSDNASLVTGVIVQVDGGLQYGGPGNLKR